MIFPNQRNKKRRKYFSWIEAIQLIDFTCYYILLEYEQINWITQGISCRSTNLDNVDVVHFGILHYTSPNHNEKYVTIVV